MVVIPATASALEVAGQVASEFYWPAISLCTLDVVVIACLRQGLQHEVTDVIAVAQEAEQGADVAFRSGESPAILHALEFTQGLQLMIKFLWIH